MVPDTLNVWATFRFALSYPDERHQQRFMELLPDKTPPLNDLRSQYIELFEAGLPQPKCPLLESAYAMNRSAGEIVLENKMFYQNFGLRLDSRAAPDHLLTQIEFLAWLDHCLAVGNRDRDGLQRAQRQFLERHLANWIPAASRLACRHTDGIYADLLRLIDLEVARILRD